MRCGRLLVAFVLTWVWFAAPARANWPFCIMEPGNGPTPGEQIAACSALLAQGGLDNQSRARGLKARGRHYEALGDYQRAIDDYSRIVELDPRSPEGYRLRCLAYARIGEAARALADCDKGIQLAPQNTTSYETRAWAYDALGQHDRAIEDATRALDIPQPFGRPSLLCLRGNLYRKKRDYPRAIADYNAALVLLPNWHLALNGRGLVYRDAGDPDGALADFTAAIEDNPYFAAAFANRATVHRHRERYDFAIADMDRAIKLQPNNATYFHNRAFDHLLAENYDLAEADALRALQLAPGLGGAEITLAQARTAKAAIAARKIAPPTKARIALVIGNSKYLYGPPLPNPVHDAQDVARELAKIGYKIYGHPKSDFTRADMYAAIDAFFEAAKGAESAIVWYSGHGQEFVEIDGDYGRNYVIPVDAKIASSKGIRAHGIALSELLMSVMPATGLRMVIVDACRSNDFDPAIPFRGFAREGRLGMFVVYSTKPGTYAADGNGRNSPFAQAFVGELQASPKDELRVLLARVTRRTSAATQQQQVPEIVDRYEPVARPVLVR